MNSPLVKELALSRQQLKNECMTTFVKASTSLGNNFIGHGGPVTRFEALIASAGNIRNYDTNVQATPSSVIVSCSDLEDSSITRSQRIFSASIDLGYLKTVDRILLRFSTGELSGQATLKNLASLEKVDRNVHFALRMLALFSMGCVAAMLNGASPLQALAGGLTTLVIFCFVEGINKVFNFNQFFKVFIMSLTSLTLAAIITNFTSIPSFLLAIGTFAYIVPGLLLTTAVSEIVDQHFLSGSMRLLKASAVFLTMGMAFYLAQDTAMIFKFENILETDFPRWYGSDWLGIRLASIAVMTLGFSIEFRAHKKTLWKILVCSLSGASVFFVSSYMGQLYLSSFLASAVIGLISYYFSRKKEHPSQIYSVPSILSLVPGMLAFSSFKLTSTHPLVSALLVSLAIVFGLACSRFPLKSSIRLQTGFD